MPYTTVVSTDILAQHLRSPDWVIIDCRFDLANPNWGYQEYLNGHIPGAFFANLDHDLASPITPTSGRHPLPDPDQWREIVSKWGITPDTQVVAYDSTGGSLAAVRVWWLLRAYHHRNVAVLDGSFPKWVQENRPLETDLPQPRQRSVFTNQLDPQVMVTSSELVDLHTNPEVRLIDARAAERFRGEIEPIDPVAGHIPGAKNRPVAQNLDANLTFKTPEQLRLEFIDLLQGISPDNVIAYCGSGITAAHNLLALEIAGLSGARLYAGSWSEWIRDPSRLVQTGE